VHGTPVLSDKRDGIVYVGSSDGSVKAFNATTGASLWTATTGPIAGYSSPVVANGVVYIGSADSNVYAFGLP
jgi:outer membrane protein assembly factor BamB